MRHLLRAQIFTFISPQTGKAQDAVQRRTQLMRHAGQESRFGAIGLLRRFTRTLTGGFGLKQAGNFAEHPHDVALPALICAGQLAHHEVAHAFAAFHAQFALDHLRQRFGQTQPVARFEGLGEIGWQELRRHMADHRAGRGTEKALAGRIDHQIAMRLILDEDRIRNRVKHMLQLGTHLCLGLQCGLQQLFGLAPGSNIEVAADDHRLAVQIARWRLVHDTAARQAGSRVNATLFLVDMLAREHAGIFVGTQGGRGRVWCQLERTLAQQGLARLAALPAEGRINHHITAAGVLEVERLRQRIHQLLQRLLTEYGGRRARPGTPQGGTQAAHRTPQAPPLPACSKTDCQPQQHPSCRQ